jgi:hypothetical protein
MSYVLVALHMNISAGAVTMVISMRAPKIFFSTDYDFAARGVKVFLAGCQAFH